MDYTRNEDKQCYYPSGSNRLIDISVEEDENVGEPVTLDEIKSHLNITFADNDSYLLLLGKMCRAAVEKYTGLSLVEKSVTVHLDNYEGGYELPYGPIVGTPYVTNEYDVVITGSVFSGIKFKRITSPSFGGLRLRYTAGYDVLPADLKLAILEEIAFRNENRGDQIRPDGLSPISKTYAKAHRRVSSIL